MKKKQKPKKIAFLKFECSRGEEIYVYSGKLSELDIVVKYKQNGSRERTPKHIHWTVDLLLKKQGDGELTNELLDYLYKMWKEIKPIKSEKERENIELEYKNYPKKFKTLDKYGYYSTEFIVILAELLAIQEKTNRKDAYMFGKVLVKTRDSSDIFSIISQATYNGK